MVNREEAEYVLGTVYSMKEQEAEDYVQLANDLDLRAELPEGVWWGRTGAFENGEDVCLLYTAASRARLGLFCDKGLAKRVEGVCGRRLGVQVSQSGVGHGRKDAVHV